MESATAGLCWAFQAALIRDLRAHRLGFIICLQVCFSLLDSNSLWQELGLVNLPPSVTSTRQVTQCTE